MEYMYIKRITLSSKGYTAKIFKIDSWVDGRIWFHDENGDNSILVNQIMQPRIKSLEKSNPIVKIYFPIAEDASPDLILNMDIDATQKLSDIYVKALKCNNEEEE